MSPLDGGAYLARRFFCFALRREGISIMRRHNATALVLPAAAATAASAAGAQDYQTPGIEYSSSPR